MARDNGRRMFFTDAEGETVPADDENGVEEEVGAVCVLMGSLF